MELFDNLGLGIETALRFENLLYCLIGVALGTAVGVLPGIGPTATIALLLPIGGGVLTALAASAMYCADTIWGQRIQPDTAFWAQFAVFNVVFLIVGVLGGLTTYSALMLELLLFARLEQADDVGPHVAPEPGLAGVHRDERVQVVVLVRVRHRDVAGEDVVEGRDVGGALDAPLAVPRRLAVPDEVQHKRVIPNRPSVVHRRPFTATAARRPRRAAGRARLRCRPACGLRTGPAPRPHR